MKATFPSRLLFPLLLAVLAGAPSARAHEGHDHGAPPPPVSVTIAPRADASSADFELVAIARGSALRIYVDNEPAGVAMVGPSGRWDAVLERTLQPGDYTLRLDQLGASGKPDARIETPFTRVGHPPGAGDVEVDYVIVQPGNSLWRIAKRVFGEGLRYMHIYEANQAPIRDPDLIYPGQKLKIPPK